MIRKVTRWETDDGSLFELEELAKQYECGYNFKCPNCHGKGKIRDMDKPILQILPDEFATAWGGHMSMQHSEQVTGYQDKPCNVCGGLGWTEKEMVPLTESRIVGYQAKP